MLENELKARVLRLDGAMGTQIQQYGLQPGEDLNLSRPDVIKAIHQAYIDAGADIIETNSFNVLGEHAAQNAREGARLARQVADAAPRKVWVAGSMGPSSKSLTLSPDISRPAWREYDFDQMAGAYAAHARALIEGGVDFLLLETSFDALNTKAALYGIHQVHPGFPVMVSVSVSDRSGRTLTGQTLEAFFTAVSHYPLLAFGLNCSLGAEELLPLVKGLSAWCPVPIVCYPNAGLPNEMGAYDQTPEQMAAQIAGFDGLVNIIGGCCGTTPAHIQKLPALTPRALPSARKVLTVSGLEAWTVDTRTQNFTLIGERTNVAGSRKFAKLIAAQQYDEALQVAAGQIEGGAGIIDINMDDAMLDGPVAMETFVRLLQNDPAVARAALMIDSSHWETLLKGLKNAQGKCIVNSISLKDGEKAFLEKAAEIHRLGAAMVVMAFDEQGQATTYPRKTEICQRAYKLLTGIGIPPQDIIFDVNVLSVATGIAEHDRYAVDFIDAVAWIKKHLPGAYTSGGISNLSFAFRGNNPVRSAMHAVFLYHAIRAGLDMAIVNPAMLQQYDDIEPQLREAAEDVILCRRPDATARLTEIAARYTAPAAEASATAPKALQGTPAERLKEALVSGHSASLEEDLMAVMQELGSAVKVIEGPLMAGMEEVGRRFGEGRMFLPQVVKSAKLMKDAVAILEPHIQADGQRSKRPVVISATVKGDVHDIGKNIAGTVLRCNGFDVIDLGVMVDKETILAAAKEHNAVLIGVSGLITPSLYQMEELCREMKARGLSIPLFVGGATTSDLHTAVKLAPLYEHVFHAPDASAGAVMAQRCLQDREAFEAEQHARQEEIRALREGRKPRPLAPVAFPPESFLTQVPADIPFTRISLKELEPLFDWALFRAVWGVKKPSVELEAEGRAVLAEMVRNNSVEVRLSARFFAARRDGDTLLLGDARFPMLRQEEGQGRSLADYVPADGSGPFGIFALAVHGHHPQGCTCEACRSEYDSMMRRAVRVTLAEAASTWLDKQLEPFGVPVAKPAAGYASCPDHSLKRDILGLLSPQLGITLTESCAMQPDASICGFVVLHPEAGYPDIRHISPAQFDQYAKARGFTPDQARTFLSHLL